MKWVLALVLWSWGSFYPAAGLELTHSPRANEELKVGRPPITVYLPLGGALPYSQARLWVNGAEVSGRCQKTPAFISFTPRQELPSGDNTVRFVLGPYDQSWNFSVHRLVRLLSVSYTAPANLSELDEVEILVSTVKLPDTAKLWFEVESLEEKFPLVLAKPGEYHGRFVIPAGWEKGRASVTAFVQVDSEKEQKNSAKPLSFLASTFRLKVLEPAKSSTIGKHLHMTGVTRPNSLVKILPVIAFRDGIEFTSAKPLPPPKVVKVKADAKGQFEFDFDKPQELPRMLLNLTIIAEDPFGHQSAALKVMYQY